MSRPRARALPSFVLLSALGCAPSQPPNPLPAPTPAPTPAPSPAASAAAPSASPTPNPQATPSPTGACARDDECAVTTTTSCCECAAPPFGTTKQQATALRDQCAVVECSRGPRDCKPVPSPDDYRAVCRDSACVAAHVSAPPPIAPASLTSTDACRRDSDCVVSNWTGCCSDCGSSAYATSQRELDGRHRICARVDCAMQEPRDCPPVVDAALYRAVCRAAKCGGEKRP